MFSSRAYNMRLNVLITFVYDTERFRSDGNKAQISLNVRNVSTEQNLVF